MKTIIVFILVIVLFFWKVTGQNTDQNVLSTSGNYFEKTNGSLSWNLGEIMTETYQGTDYIITQGFEQSLFKVVFVSENARQNYGINVFPNPAINYLNINFKSENTNSLKLEIYNPDGKKLMSKLINSQDNKIDLRNFSTDILFIKIYDLKHNFIQSYKVLKLK